jgi:hypothetical protein
MEYHRLAVKCKRLVGEYRRLAVKILRLVLAFQRLMKQQKDFMQNN